MSIIISGSLVYDRIMNFPDSFKNHILPDQIHILNVCFMIDRLEQSWGGTAGNIAFTVKLLGGDPIIVSAVGKDGKDYLEYFKSHGISVDHIQTNRERFTASAYITTDVDDNQITAFFNGPLGDTQRVSLRELKNHATIALVSPTQKEVMIEHLNEAHALGLTTVFDPGQQITAFNEIELQKMVGQSYFVIGNDYEIKLLQDRTGWDAAAMLRECQVLVTTLGDKGCMITTREGKVIAVPACPPRSVDDPTGAGDAFRAGFFVGYEKGLDLKTCAQIGSVAASYAIETYGTQAHAFTKEEFQERYRKTYQAELVF